MDIVNNSVNIIDDVEKVENIDTFKFVFIFIIILTIYLHINNELKKVDNVQIYEIDYLNNEQLQQTCDLKTPFIFILNIKNSNIGDLKDSVKVCDNQEKGHNISIDLSFSSAKTLIETDPKSRYYSELNYDFTKNNMEEVFSNIDYYLKPKFSLLTDYDYMFGSKGTVTPLKYIIKNRNFIVVEQGEIQVKMIPFKHSFNFKCTNDYKNLQYISKKNIWDEKHDEFFDTTDLKILDFNLKQGDVLFIPSFWLYSIKYVKNNTFIYNIHYQTLTNCLINIPNYIKILFDKVDYQDNLTNLQI